MNRKGVTETARDQDWSASEHLIGWLIPRVLVLGDRSLVVTLLLSPVDVPRSASRGTTSNNEAIRISVIEADRLG